MKYHDRPRRFYIILWIGVLGLVVAGMFAKPAYQAYKRKKALELVEEINSKDFPASDWDSVGRKLRLAHGYSANEPEVLRLAARYLSAGGQQEALQYFSMLVDTGKATVTDRIEYARQALRHNRPDVSRVHARQALIDSPMNVDALMVGIEALDRLGLQADATSLAEAAIQAHPTHSEAALRLGWLRLRDPNSQRQESGRTLLWGLAMSPGPFQGVAAERLATSPNLDRSDLRVLLKSLEATANRSFAQELVIFDLRHRLAPENERDQIALLMLHRLGTQASVDDKFQAIDWLLNHGSPRRVFDVLDESILRNQPGAAQRWLQAKANLGLWTEVAERVEDKSLLIEPNLRDCYRALLEMRRGGTNAAMDHMSRAIAGLGKNPNEIAFVANYAERLGLLKLAATAYEKLLGDPLHATRAAREMLRLLSASDDVQQLLTTLRRLHQFQPENMEVADAISWYELIVGLRVAENSAEAQERATRFPKMEQYRLTAALGQLRQNQPDPAINLLEGFGDRTNGSPRARLLYAAANGALGQRQTAQQVAGQLDPRWFKSEEYELIRPWREAMR